MVFFIRTQGEKLKATTPFKENADAMRLLYDVNKNAQETQPALNLTATEFLDKLAHLIPPPRRHRHHYHGVLAPNSKHRSRVTQFANQEYKPLKMIKTEITGEDFNFKEKSDALWQPKKSAISWAKLIRKVYEVDPLKCEQCGETMKIIAYITNATSIHKILKHIGEETEPLKMHSARGPPNECVDEDIPEYQYDQTISW